MKAERTVKHITFTPREANPGETLYVQVPKLNGNKVIVPGSLALCFNIDLTGGDSKNFLFQNVSRALVHLFTKNTRVQLCKTHLATTFTKFSRIFFFHSMCTKTTCCWKGFKPKHFIRFPQMPVTNWHRVWMLKTLSTPFLVKTTASHWTTKLWTITVYSTHMLSTMILFLNWHLPPLHKL